MTLLRTCVLASLSGYALWWEGVDSAVACSPIIPLNMRCKGDFFPRCVKAMDQEQVNLATDTKLVKADQ